MQPKNVFAGRRAKNFFFFQFHLPFVFRCVHASLYEGLSFGPSVRPWVSRFFGSRKLTNLTYLTNLIPAILTNLTESYKSDKSLCNSILVPYFRRIFVRTNLFIDTFLYRPSKPCGIGFKVQVI